MTPGGYERPVAVGLDGTLTLAPFCMARCCEAFHMNHEHLGWLESEPENVRDGHFIRDMLIELTPKRAQGLHRTWPGFQDWTPDEGERYFTCRHWDPATRLCTVYEERPQMCRDAGETSCCKHGCGMGC